MKTSLTEPLFRVYKVPDDGSHRLEAILEAELVYLNEFAWSEDWMKWAYLKSFFEGEPISVARPKNRGGNVLFKDDIPVVGTCSAPIQLYMRQGRQTYVNEYETQQMNARVTYLPLPQSIPGESVVECRVCLCCSAKLYLEGEPQNPPEAARNPEARSRSPARVA